MSEAERSLIDEIAVDATNLYREEIFTDLKVATIRRLAPVLSDGSDDPARPVMYVGQIVEEREVQALFETPAHPYTQALLAAVPRIGSAPGTRLRLPGDVASASAPPAGCFHSADSPHETLLKVRVSRLTRKASCRRVWNRSSRKWRMALRSPSLRRRK